MRIAADYVEGQRFTFQKLIDKFGENHQVMLAMEELAELIQALSKHRRSPDPERVAGEYADVMIMLMQIELMMPYSFRELVLEQLDIKLDRVKELLNDGILE